MKPINPRTQMSSSWFLLTVLFPDALGGKPEVQYFVNLDAEIFGGRHLLGEFWQRIQILVVEPGQHSFDKAIQIGQVADHSGFLVEPGH